MEKKMAVAAGAVSAGTPVVAEAPGGSEQMPRVMKAATPEIAGHPMRDDSEKQDNPFSIRALPDYRHIDSSGFFTDVWNAFWDDTKRIWRERSSIVAKR